MSEVLRFDIAKEPKGNPITYGRVGDSKGLTRKVKIFEDGKPFDLTGWTITFEGNTSKYKTKVFDSDGISNVDEKTGEFNYIFPNMAFAVEGQYERAYFSFIKDDLRKSTGNFEIIVFDNSDIDAPEAETIITEYNKLVDELHKITDKYIEDSDKTFEELDSKISSLQTQIKNFESAINKTVSDAESSISTVFENTIKTISDALDKFTAADFYNKSDADERFAKKSDLTKDNVGLSNVDNYATANQTDAEQGLAGNKFMSPIGVKQHVDNRIATQAEAEAGETNDKLMTPLRTLDEIKKNTPIEVYIAHTSTVLEVDNVVSGIKLPIGDIQAVDKFHTIDDLPFTISSDKTTITMTRDATLLIQQLQEGRGNASNSYTDYFYFYINGGTTRYDGIKYGVDTGATAINLSHTGMGQCVMPLKAGDTIWTSVSTRSSDKKLWKGSVRGTYIKELKTI